MNDRPSETDQEDLAAWERGVAAQIARDSASDEDTEAALRSVMDRIAASPSTGRPNQDATPPQFPAPEQTAVPDADELKALIYRLLAMVIVGHLRPAEGALRLDQLLEDLPDLGVHADDLMAEFIRELAAGDDPLASTAAYEAVADLARLCRAPGAQRLFRDLLSRAAQDPQVQGRGVQFTYHNVNVHSVDHSHHGNYMR
ncbi:hypothetical protein ABZ307_44320 [Streptomyces griseorubiginosus]|uniref:hypothetical protein n=1 Tax=Streptomyces griseorubiginosus TaxID=67304 RepID=UPI0033ABDD8A